MNEQPGKKRRGRPPKQKPEEEAEENAEEAMRKAETEEAEEKAEAAEAEETAKADVLAEAEAVVESKAQSEQEIEKSEPADVNHMTDAEKKALENRLHIMQLAQGAQSMFLEMGHLLYDVREEGQWTILKYESIKDYIEDLGLPMTNSYSWATRLIGIYEYMIVKLGLDEKRLMLIGVAKLSRLLPVAKDGNLDDELLAKAEALSDMDLRIELGHSVGGSDSAETITCPRCGAEVHGAKQTGNLWA